MTREAAEPSLSAVVARAWRPQVVASIGILRFVRLLCVVARACEIAVDVCRCELVAKNRRHGRPAEPDFSLTRLYCPTYSLGANRGIVDGQHRLRPSRHAAARPIELRRIERRHLHHRHVHVDVVMQQLAAERIAKALNGMFRGAVGCLQRNAAIRQRRSNLHDRAAIARPHSP